MMANFGWVKDKWDGRDYLFKPKLVTVPDIVDLSEFLPEVRDQGSSGSCVGFGVGINLTAWAKKLKVFQEWFSPRWIYNGARFIEGALDEEGCYPRDAFEWLRKKGCLLEHFWSYVIPDDMPPPSHLEPEAAKWPLFAYYRVDNGVDGIMLALAEGNFVTIGTPWFWSWMNPPGGILPKVNIFSGVAGGHATTLVGYRKLDEMFLGVNSWSSEWGNNGKYEMPFQAFDVFKLKGGYDAHYVKVEWAEAPPPPPPPNTLQLRVKDGEYSWDDGQTWHPWPTQTGTAGAPWTS